MVTEMYKPFNQCFVEAPFDSVSALKNFYLVNILHLNFATNGQYVSSKVAGSISKVTFGG